MADPFRPRRAANRQSPTAAETSVGLESSYRKAGGYDPYGPEFLKKNLAPFGIGDRYVRHLRGLSDSQLMSRAGKIILARWKKAGGKGLAKPPKKKTTTTARR